MSQNQRPRGYSFDGSLPPARVLAVEAELYHHFRELDISEARGNFGLLPRPSIVPFRPELYDQLVPNPILPSHAASTSIRTPDSEPHYAPNRQQDIASKPGRQYLKYMRLFFSPNTLIPNCKSCLFSTDHYRFLHERPPGNPQATEYYKPAMFLSKIPPEAVNIIEFRAKSPKLYGVSMTLLLYQNVGADHEEKPFPHFKEHPLIRVVFRAFGYADVSFDIRTVCSHGAITKIGLAYAIARIYNRFLQEGRRIDQRVVPGPVYAGLRDYRLLAVYAVPQVNGTYVWYAYVALTSYDGRLQ